MKLVCSFDWVHEGFLEKTVWFSIERKSRPAAGASSLSRKTKTGVSPKAEVSTVLSAFLHTYRGQKEDNWREWKGSGRWSDRRFFITRWMECFGGTSSQVGRRLSQTGLTFLVSSRQRLQWRNGALALLKLLLRLFFVLLAMEERS